MKKKKNLEEEKKTLEKTGFKMGLKKILIFKILVQNLF